MAIIEVKTLNKSGTTAMTEEFKRITGATGLRFDSKKIIDEDEHFEQFLDGKMKIDIPSAGQSRQFLSELLFKSFNDVEEKISDHLDNKGLWNWFMLRLGPFHHLSFDGEKLTDQQKYIHNGDGYRHHLANLAWIQEKIQKCGFGKLMLIPSNRPQDGSVIQREMQFGEVQEQVVQGHILRTDACFELVEKLFYDEDKDYWKAGIASNKRQDALRKLKKFLYKLDAVYDVHSMTYTELLGKVTSDGRFSKRLVLIDGKWK